MKLSIFTTISDYENNHWKESLQSYLDLADEVVVVNGANKEVDITNLCGAYGAWSGLQVV